MEMATPVSNCLSGTDRSHAERGLFAPVVRIEELPVLAKGETSDRLSRPNASRLSC
jgi:hypothetical protein